MKKFLIIFVGLIMVAPAFATEPTYLYPEASVASARLVEQAYNALDTAKQPTLYTDTNNPDSAGTVRQAVTSGTSGAVVTGVTASNGVVTVTRGEVTIPSGSASSSTRAQIWFE